MDFSSDSFDAVAATKNRESGIDAAGHDSMIDIRF
jgi:hypothetical protein